MPLLLNAAFAAPEGFDVTDQVEVSFDSPPLSAPRTDEAVNVSAIGFGMDAARWPVEWRRDT